MYYPFWRLLLPKPRNGAAAGSVTGLGRQETRPPANSIRSGRAMGRIYSGQQRGGKKERPHAYSRHAATGEQGMSFFTYVFGAAFGRLWCSLDKARLYINSGLLTL